MFVRDREPFLRIMDQVREAGEFAWDTEFIQDRTYWPRLCLVQVAVGDVVAAIDPFEVGDLTPLWDLIADPGIRVVLHAGGQDIQIAWDNSKRPARNVYDTQMAASFAGYGDSISYAGLISRELGIRLAKGETMTDWSRRPLADSQLEYALDDVRHLLQVKERLDRKLNEAGRQRWIDEELRTYEDETRYERDPRQAWRRLSKRRTLDRKALGVLRELAAWREEEAAARDVPRNRVVTDEILVEIARRGPRRMEKLSAIRNLHARTLKQSGEEILRRVAIGLEVPADERPEPPRGRSEDPARARLVDLLDMLVQLRARETGVARNVLATRVDLDHVVEIHLDGASDGRPPAILTGWRADLVGRDLGHLLDGKLVMGVNPRTRLPEVVARPGLDGAGPGER